MMDNQKGGGKSVMIEVHYDADKPPTVLGRDLHEALMVKQRYGDWFHRMLDYGFVEGRDFYTCAGERYRGKSETQHALTLGMAREICMVRGMEIGRRCREWFMELESSLNRPESVVQQGFKLAGEQLSDVVKQNRRLTEESAIHAQQLAELRPQRCYFDVCLETKDAVPISVIASDYGWSADTMNAFLVEHGVWYKQGDVWLLRPEYMPFGYTDTRVYVSTGADGEPHNKAVTMWTQKGRLLIYGLMKSNGILPELEKGK